MAYTKQTWENLPSTNTPITADKLNHIEDGIYDAYTINNSYSTSQTTGYSSYYINNNYETKGTILWTNEDTSEEWASSRQITMSTSDYDCYMVVYTTGSSGLTSVKNTGLIPKGKTTQLEFFYNVGSGNNTAIIRRREFAYNNDTHYTVSENMGADGNYACRPLYVVGYKTGLFS